MKQTDGYRADASLPSDGRALQPSLCAKVTALARNPSLLRRVAVRPVPRRAARARAQRDAASLRRVNLMRARDGRGERQPSLCPNSDGSEIRTVTVWLRVMAAAHLRHRARAVCMAEKRRVSRRREWRRRLRHTATTCSQPCIRRAMLRFWLVTVRLASLTVFVQSRHYSVTVLKRNPSRS